MAAGQIVEDGLSLRKSGLGDQRLPGEQFAREHGKRFGEVQPGVGVSSFYVHFPRLNPGDVVLTGTPAGVGELSAGDVVEVEVEGHSVIRNPVVALT